MFPLVSNPIRMLMLFFHVHIIFDRGYMRSTVDDGEKGTTIRPRASTGLIVTTASKRGAVQATKDSLNEAHEEIELHFTACVAKLRDGLRAYPCHKQTISLFSSFFLDNDARELHVYMYMQGDCAPCET
jgi:hypothetical protein